VGRTTTGPGAGRRSSSIDASVSLGDAKSKDRPSAWRRCRRASRRSRRSGRAVAQLVGRRDKVTVEKSSRVALDQVVAAPLTQLHNHGARPAAQARRRARPGPRQRPDRSGRSLTLPVLPTVCSIPEGPERRGGSGLRSLALGRP
jgi:hypothetical protein